MDKAHTVLTKLVNYPALTDESSRFSEGPDGTTSTKSMISWKSAICTAKKTGKKSCRSDALRFPVP